MLRVARFTPALPSLLALLLAALGTAVAQGAGLTGAWEGSIDPAELDLRIEIEFETGRGGYTGTLAVPLQGATGLELTDVRVGADGSVRWTAPDLPRSASFDGLLRGDRIEGLFRQGGVEVPFVLTRARAVEGIATPEGWTGDWRGVLAPGVADFEMSMRLTDDDGRLGGTLSIPAQGLDGLALRFESAGDGVTVSVPALPSDARFGLRLEDGALVGTYGQEGVTFPVVFERVGSGGEDAASADAARPQTPLPPFPYRSEPLTVDAGDVTLAGTLTVPEGDGPFPAVLLLNGSGAQDRDGIVLGHAPFLVLADRLTRDGLAVLRLDDRGVGLSGGDPSAADHDRLALDARAALRTLGDRPEIDAGRLAVLGHSEGGLVAPRVVASGDPPLAALVLVGAPAVEGLRVLELQNRVMAALRGADESWVDAQVEYLNELADALVAGDTAEAMRLTRARVEVQLADLPEGQVPTGAARERLVESQAEAAATPGFAAFVLADPQPWLRRVDVPTLAVYGRHDTQVPAVQNEGPMRAALRLAGVSDATVVTLPGLNHLMQPAPVGGAEEYASISTTLAPEYLDLVSEWLTERLLD